MQALQLHHGSSVREHDLLDHSADSQEHADMSAPDLGLGGETTANFVDMSTIRQRVALIKNRWSPETVRARAIEGARRRVELEGLVANLMDFDADEHFGEDSGLKVFL